MVLRARKQLTPPPPLGVSSKPALLNACGAKLCTATPPALATLTSLASLGRDCQPASPSFCVVSCLAANGHAGNCLVKDADDGALSRVPMSIKRKWVVWKKCGCPEEADQPADGDAPETPKRLKSASALAELQMRTVA